MYYNKKILEKSGVKAEDLVTWDDVVKAGHKIQQATGKPIFGVGTSSLNFIWPMVLQQGSYLINKDGSYNLASDTSIKTLNFLDRLVNEEKVAVPAAGGSQDNEKYYGFMNNGGAAAVLAPMWYMSRFVQYMPDLKSKMIIRPMPKWKDGGDRSAGIGGTGTVIPKQGDHIELAKKFLRFAKVTKAANIRIWKQLGFIPPRHDVYDSPELKKPNKFTKYFANDDIFQIVQDIRKEINGPHVVGGMLPKMSQALTDALYSTIRKNNTSAKDALQKAQADLSQ
jgi:arabinosaccharide transport system substrate-binding protein